MGNNVCTTREKNKSAKVRMTSEEAYMIKKQQSLNLHQIECRIMFAQLQPLKRMPSLNLGDYSVILKNKGLLKDDFPRSDARFTNYYVKLAWSQDNHICTLPTSIALIMLCNGTHELKSTMIASLFIP